MFWFDLKVAVLFYCCGNCVKMLNYYSEVMTSVVFIMITVIKPFFKKLFLKMILQLISSTYSPELEDYLCRWIYPSIAPLPPPPPCNQIDLSLGGALSILHLHSSYGVFISTESHR